MKKFKRFIAVLLSVIFILSAMPYSVFAGSIPDELNCDYGNDNMAVFNYCGELRLGENPFPDVDYEKMYFGVFVPENTGIYSFRGNINGITGDTNDDRCLSDEFEDGMYFFSEDEGGYDFYCLLTEGKEYFVLMNTVDELVITYEGIITDLRPVLPLDSLLEDWDIYETEDGMLGLDADLEVVFSNNKTVLTGWTTLFDQDCYTENTLTWNHLGFKKVLRYSTIKIEDMIDSVKVKDTVNFVRYFDGRLELKKPATVEIKFKNGKTVEVSVDNYDYSYEFMASNDRQYYVSFYVDDSDELLIYIANAEYEGSDCKIKSAGFFRNLQYYLLCKASINTFYREMMKFEDYNTRVSLFFDRMEEINELRTEFLRSIFTR